MTTTRLTQLPMECVTGDTRCKIMYDTCPGGVGTGGVVEVGMERMNWLLLRERGQELVPGTQAGL